jgi:microsomal epoxide hydrolase
MAPSPSRIAVPDAVLADLRERLARTRWPEAIPDAGWAYGADLDYLRELCDYWRTSYDWRRHEAAINAVPQFTAQVDGVDLRFMHVRGSGRAPFPLLLLHGWPGSIYEFFELLGPLSDPAAHAGDAADAFDLVIPELPGFGFGGRPREPGWGVTRIAAALDTLMHERLGYPAYGVQGGDWGGIIASKLASAHAERVTAIHLNMLVAGPPEEPDERDAAALEHVRVRERDETGYSRVQRSKPDALTVAQSDSPAGLAAWIVEKFRAWSDCDGDVERAFSRDTLLTNLMFYWAPNAAPSAARIYYESVRDRAGRQYPRIEVPTGVASFPKEPWRVPRHWAEPRYTITHWTDMPRGGHFAALEQPELLLADVRAFFRSVR